MSYGKLEVPSYMDKLTGMDRVEAMRIAGIGHNSSFSPDWSSFKGDNVLGTGMSLFGNTAADGKGGIMQNKGLVDYGMSAFDTYNRWAQGNQLAEAREKALELEEYKFGINAGMKRDAYNRKVNGYNATNKSLTMQAEAAANGQAPLSTHQVAQGTKQYRDASDAGTGIVQSNGNVKQIVSLKGDKPSAFQGTKPQNTATNKKLTA